MKRTKNVTTISICIPTDLVRVVDDICMSSYISRSHYITSLIRADIECMDGIADDHEKEVKHVQNRWKS